MAVKGALFGSSSGIVCGGNDLTLGGFTIVAVCRTASDDETTRVVFGAIGGGGTTLPWGLFLDWAGPNEFGVAWNSINSWGASNSASANTYYMLVYSVNYDGSVSRIHHYIDGVGWTHFNYTYGSFSTISGTIDSINFGMPTFGAGWVGEIAYAAIFEETGAIPSDATVETYSDYDVLEAKSLKRFSTGRSLQGAGTIVDSSGNGNHEVSRSGISVGSYGVPSWFTNFEVVGGATGRPKYWNGSAWVQKPAKVWNGSSWVEKPTKVWNGSSWVTVD